MLVSFRSAFKIYTQSPLNEQNIIITISAQKIDIRHAIPDAEWREPGGSAAVQPQGAGQSGGGRAAAVYFKLSLAQISPAGLSLAGPRLTDEALGDSFFIPPFLAIAIVFYSFLSSTLFAVPVSCLLRFVLLLCSSQIPLFDCWVALRGEENAPLVRQAARFAASHRLIIALTQEPSWVIQH